LADETTDIARTEQMSKHIRDVLTGYFIKQGQVPWQWKHANISLHSSHED